MQKMHFILLILIANFSVKAAEVDQFSRNKEALVDASEIINNKANDALATVVNDLNQQNSGCDEQKLYAGLREYFGNHIHGIFTKEIIKGDDIPRIHIEVRDSVYRDWNSLDGVLLGTPILKKSGISISDVVRIGNVEIGTDKFEHLFGRGFTYFTKHYLQNKSIDKTLRYGSIQEKFLLGGTFFETGVYSYADLSANFNGMRFWNHVLLKNDDILGKEYNVEPFVKCENDQWVVNSKIDFRNYFDEAVNESKNCSKFATKDGAKKFQEELDKENEKCGFTLSEYEKMRNKYGELAPWFINIKGQGKVTLKDAFHDE